MNKISQSFISITIFVLCMLLFLRYSEAKEIQFINPMEFNFLYLVSFLFFIILVLIEHFNGNSKEWTKNEKLLDIFYNILSFVIGILLSYLFGSIYKNHQNNFENHSILISSLALLIAIDLIFYWQHRLLHHINLLWPIHRPHHSSAFCGAVLHGRNSIYLIFLSPVTYIMLFLSLAGFGIQIAICSFIISLTVTITHSTFLYQLVRKNYYLKRLEYFLSFVLVTPSMHRIHHYKNNLNQNFGNTFSIFDNIFKTRQYLNDQNEIFGVSENFNRHWFSQLFLPFAKSNQKSED